MTQSTFTYVAGAFIGVIYNNGISVVNKTIRGYQKSKNLSNLIATRLSVLLGDPRNVNTCSFWLVVLGVTTGSKEDILCILVYCHISNLHGMPVMSLQVGHLYYESTMLAPLSTINIF